jgi:hypothetical protein
MEMLSVYKLMVKGGMSASFGFGYQEAMKIPLDKVAILNEILKDMNDNNKNNSE